MPVFSLEVGEGWDNTADSPTEYVLQRTGPDGQPAYEGIYIFRNVAVQAASCEDAPEPGIGRTPEAMAAYWRDLPALTTTEPEAVNVGGLDGVMIDVAMAPSWTTPCHYSEGEPNVPLFWGADTDSGLEWSVGPGEHEHLYILALSSGANVIIDVDASLQGAGQDAFLEIAGRVVESITFDPNYY